MPVISVIVANQYVNMVRGRGFEPLNRYGRDLKSRAFGRLGYPRTGFLMAHRYMNTANPRTIRGDN